MDIRRKVALVIGVAALMLTPTSAFAEGPEYAPEHPTHPTHPTHPYHPTTPGPKAPLPEKAKAYGVYCREFPKKHVDGKPGTPFSLCVTAAAKVVNPPELTAKAACKVFSKKHVKGQKRTPFSQCVVAVAQAKKALTTA